VGPTSANRLLPVGGLPPDDPVTRTSVPRARMPERTQRTFGRDRPRCQAAADLRRHANAQVSDVVPPENSSRIRSPQRRVRRRHTGQV